MNKLDKKTGHFRHYNKENGFITNTVLGGPLEDSKGKLWMSSDSGVIKFNPEEGVVEKIFKKSDGLQGDVFQYFSAFKSQDEEIWFAGMNGINSFNSKEITKNHYTSPVYLTSLSHGGDDIEVDQALTKLSQLKLDWHNNFFEFEFASPNFTQPEKTQYMYMLEGLDSKWFKSGSRRFGRYTNLPGGSFTLRIKASNNDGVWLHPDQEVALNILVSSPFWKTLWFYICLTAALLIIAAFTIMYLFRLKFEVKERKNAEYALRKSINCRKSCKRAC